VKKLQLPAELKVFIDRGDTTLHCEDGEWELRVEPAEQSQASESIPPRSLVIAENGSGDFLFLRPSKNGLFDRKVSVYWHEEDRHEMFAKDMKALLDDSRARAEQQAGSDAVAKTADRAAATNKTPLTKIEKGLASSDRAARDKAQKQFVESGYGLKGLRLLRTALASDDVNTVIWAAKQIGKLGPDAKDDAAAESSPEFGHSDLTEQLTLAGSKVWSYSGYPNCYSTCLEALLALDFEDEFLVEHIHNHIGLNNPDDLIASLKALQHIGTRQAIELLKRAATFWLPELNLAQAKKVKAIVAEAGRAKRKS
jgi:hypothetical protein